MKKVTDYFFYALILLQIVIIAAKLLGFGVPYICNPTNWGWYCWKLYFPLLIFAFLKIGFWVAAPFSELFTIILNWVVILGICFLFYNFFFVDNGIFGFLK